MSGLGIVIVIIAGIIVAFVLGVVVVHQRNMRRNEEDVLRYLADNKDRSSLVLVQNDRPIIMFQPDNRLPLASTLKVAVALQFATQVVEGKIQLYEKVPLSELGRLYVPNSDGNAHKDWLHYLSLTKQDSGDEVTLMDVARGMIQHSSNANTEFLLKRLGIQNVNEGLKKFGVQNHDSIFPLSPAFLLPAYWMDTNGLNIRQARKRLYEIENKLYMEEAIQLFNQIEDSAGEGLIAKLNRPITYDLELQRLWSEKMPRSTAREYTRLMNMIQSGKGLELGMQEILLRLIEVEPRRGSKFDQLGVKGGSSLSICNQLLFCRDREGNRIQLALFIHETDRTKMVWLEKKANLFIHKLLNEESFRNRAASILNKEGLGDHIVSTVD